MVEKQRAPPEEDSTNAGVPEKEFDERGNPVSKGNPGPGYGIWEAGGNATAGEDESTGPR